MAIIRKSEVAKEKQEKELKSRKERRKNFDPRKWANKHLRTNPMRPYIDIDPTTMDWDDITRRAVEKCMSNADRKGLGVEIDKGLEPVPCDKCGKETVELKMIPLDVGKGLEFVYNCQDCLSGK